jgi:hypothetical protein
MSTLKTNLMIEPSEIFSTSSTQGTDIGALATTGDGRYFRYCLAGGTTLVPGKLQQASAEDTSNMQNLAITNASANATSITTTTTVTLTANQVAGGLIVISKSSTGAGLTYKIASHAAATAAVVTFNLEDPVVTATTGTTTVDVAPNPFSGVIVNPSSASSAPIGAAIYPITNAQYGWLQVQGACAPYAADATIAVGTQVCASNATAGAIEGMTGVQALVGTTITGIAVSEYGLVSVQLV